MIQSAAGAKQLLPKQLLQLITIEMSSKSNNLTAENNASSKICERLYYEVLPGTAVTYLIGTKEDNGYRSTMSLYKLQNITEALEKLQKMKLDFKSSNIASIDIFTHLDTFLHNCLHFHKHY